MMDQVLSIIFLFHSKSIRFCTYKQAQVVFYVKHLKNISEHFIVVVACDAGDPTQGLVLSTQVYTNDFQSLNAGSFFSRKTVFLTRRISFRVKEE
jgi:hypothetical protein